MSSPPNDIDLNSNLGPIVLTITFFLIVCALFYVPKAPNKPIPERSTGSHDARTARVAREARNTLGRMPKSSRSPTSTEFTSPGSEDQYRLHKSQNRKFRTTARRVIDENNGHSSIGGESLHDENTSTPNESTEKNANAHPTPEPYRPIPFLEAIQNQIKPYWPFPRAVSIRDAKKAFSLMQTSHFTLRSAYFQPMTRLFLIENAFTTLSTEYRTHFVQETRNMLNQTKHPAAWMSLAEEARVYIRDRVSGLSQGESIPLRSLCQNLAFRMAVLKFYGRQIENMPSEPDVEFVVSRLHGMFVWWQKKSSQRTKQFSANEERQKRELMPKLNEMFKFPVGQTMHPRDNPLNHLLTAHSAMDRIIIRCFLECRFRNSGGWRDERSDVMLKRNMMRLLNEPTEESFKGSKDESDLISVEDIVREALRLYPSGSHLRRQHSWFTWKFWEAGRMYVADIESIHRDPELWNCSAANAVQFDPRRWKNLPEGISERYMPFGAGNQSCPTKAIAGPMMIAIAVAALISAVDDDFELIGQEARMLQNEAGPLLAGRDEYAGLRLRRRRGTGRVRVENEAYNEQLEWAEYLAGKVKGPLYPLTDVNETPLGNRIARGVVVKAERQEDVQSAFNELYSWYQESM